MAPIRQRLFSRGSSLLVAACALLAGPYALAAEPPPALGLIVQLRDAPAHERTATLAAGSQAARESLRVQRVLQAAHVDGTRQHPVGRAAQLLDFGRVLGGTEAQQAAERLRAQPEVEWVVPNERERRLQVVAPNDPDFAAQWWLQAVSGSSALPIEKRLRGVPGLQTAWAYETGAPSVPEATVAMLDSGIVSHVDLPASHLVLPGYDFVSELAYSNDGDGRDADPTDPGDWVDLTDKQSPLFQGCSLEDSSWHGTINAGILAAGSDNRIGGAGINWDGRVLPVRVAGKCGATVADIIDGMRWAAGLAVANAPLNAHPARIINISFGGSSACNAAYQAAIDEVAARGTVVVAAAGNESTAPTRPANCNGVVGVGALNRDGFKSSYSNFGAALVVSTVGGDPIEFGNWGPRLGDDGLRTLLNLGTTGKGADGYGKVAGTSFSSPITSGVVSLMLSRNPGLTVAQVIQGLRLSARPHVTSTVMPTCSDAHPGRCICTASTCGSGILDVDEALRFADDPLGYVAPTRPAVLIDSPEVTAAVNSGPDRPANGVPVRNPDSGGGGALGWAWLLGLALGVVAVAAGSTGSRPRGAGHERLS